MSENKTWLKLKKKGLFIKKIWKDCAEKYKVNITIQGLDAIPTFNFNYNNHLELKTYLTQEFLKKNILASTSVYLSTYHSSKILKHYAKIFEQIFSKISYFNKNNIRIKTKLESPTCLGGLRQNSVN